MFLSAGEYNIGRGLQRRRRALDQDELAKRENAKNAIETRISDHVSCFGRASWCHELHNARPGEPDEVTSQAHDER